MIEPDVASQRVCPRKVINAWILIIAQRLCRCERGLRLQGPGPDTQELEILLFPHHQYRVRSRFPNVSCEQLLLPVVFRTSIPEHLLRAFLSIFQKHHRPLGDLERSVMEALWTRVTPGSVKDVSEALAARALAYTTLMTTLDRLFKKGLLRREKQGHAYVYCPAQAKDAYIRGLVADMLGGLKGAPREALLTGFLDFAAADPSSLAALERMIADRRQEDS
jgi:predicted transcriptional regulator